MLQIRHAVALNLWLMPAHVISKSVKRGAVLYASAVRASRAVWQRLRSNNLTPTVLAVSVAVGLAIGLLPVYGLHGLLVLAVCLPFRLDTVLAFAATMISNPVTFPFLVWLQVQLGCSIVGSACPKVETLLQGQGVLDVGYQLAIGAVVSSVLVSLLGASLVWFGAHAWRRRESVRVLPPRA